MRSVMHGVVLIGAAKPMYPYAVSALGRRIFRGQVQSSWRLIASYSDRCPSISELVIEAADLLPEQAILENFVHHNPLEHLQHLEFKEALEHVQEKEAFVSPGQLVLALGNVDPRKRVNEALVDLSSIFLDRGAAKWSPKFRDRGFLYVFSTLEPLGFAPWRRHARSTAKMIMQELRSDRYATVSVAERIIKENLDWFGVRPEDRAAAIRSMLLELKGWAGMFRRMETHPSESPANTNVRLVDFCAVQTILMRSSIGAVAKLLGWKDFTAFSTELKLSGKATNNKHQKKMHTSAIAILDQSSDRREALEAEYEKTLLLAIGTKPVPDQRASRPALQLYTCIDDREGSIRRHVEDSTPKYVESFGVPGFFGIPLVYHPADGRDVSVLAPEGQNPVAHLDERMSQDDKRRAKQYLSRKSWMARCIKAWEDASFSPIGSIALSMLAPISIVRLQLMGFFPELKQEIKERFFNYFMPKPKTDISVPYDAEEAAGLLAKTFKSIGTENRFAPIIIVLGHGAFSINNPFAAAYNCGACGGREGAPNARVLARMGNNSNLRFFLKENHNIHIPSDTVFVGGVHNTTNDTIEYFDLDLLPPEKKEAFSEASAIIDQARGRNALERCKKFLLATDVKTQKDALRHVKKRSFDAAEVRPELNHATNAAVVIGRRSLTRGLFLDRRSFLPSYDPFADDDRGTNLEVVLAPALVVCSGINLEYLFSTIDVDHHGAGTKAPLNIVGNIGVLQGTAGDLRPGLPSQMTEMHSPIRALFVVDAPIDRVESVLNRRKDLSCLVRNNWVKFIVRDPNTNQFYRQVNGEYVHIKDIAEDSMVCPVPFDVQKSHALNVVKKENYIYGAALSGMVLSCAVPMALYGADAMNPHGPMIAACATIISLPLLSFSRRYLHGEFMFGRFSLLSACLLLGFNLISTAPTLEHALAGWSLFGFASTFMIGAYNDRQTVRNNATFAFAAYRISDLSMLIAAAFSSAHIASGGELHPELVAGGLLVAAMLKSSQIPLTSLFMRSMEGPTPASALGYAGLSAHVGVILLTCTMPLWYEFETARIALGSIGALTAAYGTLVSKIRPDRKGAIANATSATLGVIYTMLALGQPEMALLASLGHASFRMIQIIRAPNMIMDSQNLRSALGYTPWPEEISDSLYKLCWTLRRLDSDLHGNWMHALDLLSRPLNKIKNLELTKTQQWAATGGIVTLAGAPFTPFSHGIEHYLMELLHTDPYLAGTIMLGHFTMSLVLIRFLFLKVLNSRRFRENTERK